MPALTEAQRFWSKVQVGADSDCWLWQGGVKSSKYGYGSFATTRSVYRSHRWAWENRAGRRLTAGEHVLHTCDVPACCNPAHLRLGSNAENVADKVAKGRQATGGRRGRGRVLTGEAVVQLRSRFAAGESVTDLAAEYGISRLWAGRVIKRRVRKVS